jgi:hypothetical protein
VRLIELIKITRKLSTESCRHALTLLKSEPEPGLDNKKQTRVMSEFKSS